MVCSCGGSCRSSDSIAGTVYTCQACGRREVIDFSARQKGPPQAIKPGSERETIELQGTMDLFEQTVNNLLTMPPMPRKRRKA